MTAPHILLRDVLYGNWFDDEGDLDRDKIKWMINDPRDPSTRFSERNIVFCFKTMTEPEDKKSLARNIVNGVYTLDMWFDLSGQYHLDAEDLDALVEQAKEKVRTVVLANQRNISGIKLARVALMRNLDNPSQNYLRTQAEIVCQFE